MTTDNKATPTEFLAPAMTMDNTSRPKLIRAEPMLPIRRLQLVHDVQRRRVVGRPEPRNERDHEIGPA